MSTGSGALRGPAAVRAPCWHHCDLEFGSALQVAVVCDTIAAVDTCIFLDAGVKKKELAGAGFKPTTF